MSSGEHRERTALIETPERLVAEVVPQFMPEAERSKMVRVGAFDRGTPGLREALEDPNYYNPSTPTRYEVREFNVLNGKSKEYEASEKELNKIRATTLMKEFFADAFLYSFFGILAAGPTFLIAGPMAASALVMLTAAYSLGKARESISAADHAGDRRWAGLATALAVVLGGAFLLFGHAFVIASATWQILAGKAVGGALAGWLAQRVGNNSRPVWAHALSGWQRTVKEI